MPMNVMKISKEKQRLGRRSRNTLTPGNEIAGLAAALGGVGPRRASLADVRWFDPNILMPAYFALKDQNAAVPLHRLMLPLLGAASPSRRRSVLCARS